MGWDVAEGGGAMDGSSCRGDVIDQLSSIVGDKSARNDAFLRLAGCFVILVEPLRQIPRQGARNDSDAGVVAI